MTDKYENSAGLGVNNHFGPRGTGRTLGTIKTEGAKNQLTIDIDINSIVDGVTIGDVYLPAGALVSSAYVEITEAFAIAGTTPDAEITVGTETSEAANGVAITEAQANSVGTYDITASIAGTWAAGLASDTLVGVAATANGSFGTTGKGRVVVEYVRV